MAEKLTITETCKILRKSTHTFLTHFHHFTSSPALLSLPFSFCLLLNLSTVAPATLHRRIHSLLFAVGIPVTSPVPQFLLIKLSETISPSLSSLPLSFSFLLLSKSSTIKFLRSHSHRSHLPPPPEESAFFALLHTQIYNLFILVAANSACVTLLCLAITAAPAWASASIAVSGPVLYSVIVANAIMLCNLSLIVSGWEGKGGIDSILRACSMLVRGRALMALFLAVPTYLAMAAIEVVFRFRIYGSGSSERPAWAVTGEAMLIAYLYSVLIVGDAIVGCLFYTSYKEEDDQENVYESDWIKLIALEQGI